MTTAAELLASYPVMLDLKLVAKVLGVHPRTVKRLIDAGRLKACKLHPSRAGRIRVRRDALVDFISALTGDTDGLGE